MWRVLKYVTFLVRANSTALCSRLSTDTKNNVDMKEIVDTVWNSPAEDLLLPIVIIVGIVSLGQILGLVLVMAMRKRHRRR